MTFNELLDKIKTPEQLSSWMRRNIRYKNFTKLMSALEVFDQKAGSCHDQVNFESKFFSRFDLKHGRLFFMECNDRETTNAQTHTLIYYIKNDKYYWFENSWNGLEGIHGPYNSLKDLKSNLIDLHSKSPSYKRYPEMAFKCTDGLPSGISLGDYVNKILNEVSGMTILEAGISKSDLMKIPLKYFGLPKYRKYPMHDETHLKSAISYFFACKPKDRPELARNIIRRHHELKSDLKISKKNPLYKYVPDSMKSLTESIIEPLISEKAFNIMKPILEAEDITLVQMLMKKDNLTDVDSLDSAVPSTYPDRNKILNAMKSIITNDDMQYPIMYTDFPICTKALKGNNGGIQIMENCSIIEYDGTLNESCALNPVQNLEHIQFCTLLREWNEGYVNCLRNYTYDRLMIETWKAKVEELNKNTNPDNKDINYQKYIDLGIDNAEKTNTGVVATIVDNINDKAEELGVPINVYSDVQGHTVTVYSEKGLDGTMIQKGQKANDDAEKYK